MIPEIVTIISKEFLDVLEKHFPGIAEKSFDSFGKLNTNGCPALERIEFCVYIELLKGGLLKDHL